MFESINKSAEMNETQMILDNPVSQSNHDQQTLISLTTNSII